MIDETAVYSAHRYDAAVFATANRLSQRERSIGFQHQGLLGPIDRVHRTMRMRFETDRASYHISATNADVAALPAYRGTGDEAVYLDEVAGRQLLHVTFGSVLTVGVDAQGRRFKDGLLEALHRHADLHSELLEKHFVKHLSLLNAG